MSKFKIGDRVRIKTDSEWYCRSLDNPKCEGTVSEVGWAGLVVVDWDNGTFNSYTDSDLELVVEEVKVNDAGETTNVTIDETLKERGSRYGTFKGHSELSQRLLGSILAHTTAKDVKLSDVHREALQMICHKIARIANGDPNYDDSWRDIAGYAQLVVKHLNGEDV